MTANLPTDPAARKKLPVFSGVVAYFPDALAAVAEVSQKGNDQHNPGEPLHWSRGKSNDHPDCLMRHLLELGHKDTDGVRHAAKLAWRALAVLQLEIEDEQALVPFPTVIEDLDQIDMLLADYPPREGEQQRSDPADCPPPGCMGDPPDPFCDYDTCDKIRAAKPGEAVDVPIFNGVPMHAYDRLDVDTPNVRVVGVETSTPRCYIAGPMRGYEQCNFPVFDEVKEYLEDFGWDCISPADLDRAEGIDPTQPGFDETTLTEAEILAIIKRDIDAINTLRPAKDAIAMIPRWEGSTGAVAEFLHARWLGLKVIHAVTGEPLDANDVDYPILCHSIYEYLKRQETPE